MELSERDCCHTESRLQPTRQQNIQFMEGDSGCLVYVCTVADFPFVFSNSIQIQLKSLVPVVS